MQFESEIKELDDATRIEIGQRIQEARLAKGLSGGGSWSLFRDKRESDIPYRNRKGKMFFGAHLYYCSDFRLYYGLPSIWKEGTPDFFAGAGGIS